MGPKNRAATLLEELVEKAGGCAVIDGAFATQLEKHGAVINDPLWSALCLIKEPDLLKRVHLEYLEAAPDLLAFETIPNKLEAQACVKLLEEENINIPSWICFSSVDGENAPSGESFEDCLEAIYKSGKVNAVGINCTPPHFIENLLCKFRKLTLKLIVVYPNSGEVWDGRAKKWLPSACFNDDKFELVAPRWHVLGASLIGGCCRTTPSTIQVISKVFKSSCKCHTGFQE